MRPFWIGFALFPIAGLTFAACSNPQVIGGNQATSSSGSSAIDCRDIPVSPDKDCNDCLYQYCCADLAVLADRLNGLTCAFSGANNSKCAAVHSLAIAFRICYHDNCLCECARECDGGSSSSSGVGGGTNSGDGG
jgi:hypothetical protein